MSPSPDAVTLRELELTYGENPIIKGIDLSIPCGETLALLGPSGCGKTTLLRLIAGLLSPSRGVIELHGEPVADAAKGLFMAPERRGLGMVFQDYALWPHMSVEENVAFALEMRGVNKSERKKRVNEVLERVGLGGFSNRRISEMSGGQQQRVALARAIIAAPRLVLFDEPLSNLDRELREEMIDEIGSLLEMLGLSAVYVTHDQSEAFTLADRVAVIGHGQIEQLGTAEELIHHPASAAVADFLRIGSLLPVEVHQGHYRLSGSTQSLIEVAKVAIPRASQVLIPTQAVQVGALTGPRLEAELKHARFRGDDYLNTAFLSHGAQPLELRFSSQQRFRPGQRLTLGIRLEALRWFPPIPTMAKE